MTIYGQKYPAQGQLCSLLIRLGVLRGTDTVEVLEIEIESIHSPYKSVKVYLKGLVSNALKRTNM